MNKRFSILASDMFHTSGGLWPKNGQSDREKTAQNQASFDQLICRFVLVLVLVLVLEAFEPLFIEDEDEHDLNSLSWG